MDFPPASATQRRWFIWLIAFIGVAQVLAGVARGVGLAPNAAFELVHTAAFVWVGTEWWARDRHRVGQYAGIDSGLFFGVVWPLALPYQLLRYHGRRGVGYVALLATAYVVPYIIGAVLTSVLYSVLVGSSGSAPPN
jgi:hypothetical protein